MFTLLGIIFFFQIELFFTLCYNNFMLFTKNVKVSKTIENPFNTFSNSPNSFTFIFFFITLVSLKGALSNGLLLTLYLTALLFQASKIMSNFILFTKTTTNFLYTLLPLFSGFLYLFFYTKSFLTLFFLVELYSVLYYFTFLTNYSFSNQTVLKYKNGLLLLLWNNFLTTFFLGMGCYLLTVKFGTTNFTELNLLTNYDSYIYVYLVGLSWKVGLPVFHFFKLEIYKYLLKENVFMFSILTTIINLAIIYFLVLQNIVFNTLYLSNWLVIVLLFTINIILINMKLTNILQYFALSSALTMTTIIIIFML